MMLLARSAKYRTLALAFAVSLLAIALVTAAYAQNLEIDIEVAPNVLNLQSKGTVVTVHTDIAFSAVAGATVTLNDVEIDYWKSDDRGNFVAKFLMSEIKGLKGLEIGELNTLTLAGETKAGEPFSGADEILVINNLPKKK